MMPLCVEWFTYGLIRHHLKKALPGCAQREREALNLSNGSCDIDIPSLIVVLRTS